MRVDASDEEIKKKTIKNVKEWNLLKLVRLYNSQPQRTRTCGECQSQNFDTHYKMVLKSQIPQVNNFETHLAVLKWYTCGTSPL